LFKVYFHFNHHTLWYVGFISIRRYRDIDPGRGDLAIIATPRDRTISCTNARLMRALLNSSHRIHRAIIIARTVTGRRLKDPDRWPVGDRVLQRYRAVLTCITLHNDALFDLYFAYSHLPYSSWLWWRRQLEIMGGQHPMSFLVLLWFSKSRKWTV